MIAFLIEDYLNRNSMYKKDFAKKLGYNPKTITNWTERRQIPVYFGARCLLKLFKSEISCPDEKLAYEELFWWIWDTEYVWRLNKLRRARGLKTESPKHLLQHIKLNKNHQAA